MERKELLTSPEYWVTQIQYDLYECALKFMEENGYNRSQLAEYLGVSKSYVTQLMSMEYDHRLSKLVDLALKFGYAPKVSFEPIAEVIATDTKPYRAEMWQASPVFTATDKSAKISVRFCDYEYPETNLKTCA